MAQSPRRNTGRSRDQHSRMEFDEFAQTQERGPGGQNKGDAEVTFDNTRQLLKVIDAFAKLRPGVELEIDRATNQGYGISPWQTDSEIQTKLRQAEVCNRKLREENENLRVTLNQQEHDKQSWHNTEITKAKEEMEAKIRYAENENSQLKEQLHDTKIALDDYKKNVRDAYSDMKDKYGKAKEEALQEKRAKEENQKLLKIKADQAEELKQIIYKQSEVIKSKSEEIREDKNQLMHLRKELDDTKSRLSKMMGHQMKDGNPYVTDLSDKNRPTKLAEMYTELYDNEWTDAFDVISNSSISQDEKETVQQLYDILLDVNKFCQVEAEHQTQQLKHGLLEGCKPDETVPESTLRQLKEFRRSNSECGLDELYEKYTRSQTGRHSMVAHNITRIPDYVKKCLYVCWFMTLQDPPLVFKIETGICQNFNKDIYKAFTKTGRFINYIVWPPLLLHAEGPLLAKGVAQCFLSSKQGTNIESHETLNRHVDKGFNSEPKQAWAIPTVTTVSEDLYTSSEASFSWTQTPTSSTYASSGYGVQQNLVSAGSNIITPSTAVTTTEATMQGLIESLQANATEATMQGLRERLQANATASTRTNKNSDALATRSSNNQTANYPSSRTSSQLS